jgi:hypothetical protein
MSRASQICKLVLCLTPTVLVGVVAMGATALGQTGLAEPTGYCSAYALTQLPPEAGQAPVPKTFPGCASYRSYRGIGRPRDYSEARACAWQERRAQLAGVRQNPKELTAWVVGGSLILADIYVNGAGVRRNIPLAMRLACESDEGMAELAAHEISTLNGLPRTHRRFEFCDHASSTLMMGFCSDYASEIEEDRRSRYFGLLKSMMTLEQLAVFEKLLSAESAYIAAHAAEVDQSGTLRGIRTTGSKSILRDLFHTKLVHFERKKWRVFSAKEISSADAWLEREYAKSLRQLRTHTKDELDLGAVSADQLVRVETIWDSYRDAWVAFARLRYPGAVAAVRTELTLERCRLLRTIQ